MNLPKIEKPQKYTGLYIFDFGDQTAIGFTATEIAELLESEKYADGKVYKIHRAEPDGTMEITAVPRRRFQLEAGMLFYCRDEAAARDDFQRLADIAEETLPPCRAKTHLARLTDDKFLVALIYPAEYDDQISSWLIKANFKTAGPVEAGTQCVTRYYNSNAEILEKNQLFAENSIKSRTGSELFNNLKHAVQR